MASRIVPEQVIDMTAPGETLRFVEILTPGGIVRVNTGLEDVRTRRAVVVVEVDRAEVTLTRRPEGENGNA